MPEEQRGYRIAERMLAEAVGEPVETIARGAWPDASFPERFERWIDEHEPELVFLKVNWYWYGYESLPLRFERLFGKPGKALGRAGLRAGKNPRFASSRSLQAGRRALTRLVGGGATHFTPEQIVDCIDACIRRGAAHENLTLVVRGPSMSGGWGYAPMTSKATWRRHDARREYIARHLKAACDRHHVFYLSQETKLTKEELKGRLTPAWFRSSPTGHTYMGRDEGEAMIAAWRQAHALSNNSGGLGSSEIPERVSDRG